jgi:hypothetical protein
VSVSLHAAEYDLYIYSLNQSSDEMLSEDVRSFFFHSQIELEIVKQKKIAFIDSN